MPNSKRKAETKVPQRVLDELRAYSSHDAKPDVKRPLPPSAEIIAVFEWLLGYSDFPQRKEGDGAYWWRKELRKKLEQLGIDIGGNVA